MEWLLIKVNNSALPPVDAIERAREGRPGGESSRRVSLQQKWIRWSLGLVFPNLDNARESGSQDRGGAGAAVHLIHVNGTMLIPAISV